MNGFDVFWTSTGSRLACRIEAAAVFDALRSVMSLPVGSKHTGLRGLRRRRSYLLKIPCITSQERLVANCGFIRFSEQETWPPS